MVFRVQAAFYRESCRIKVQAAFIVLRTRRWGIPPESAGMAAQRHANRPDTAILQKKQPAHPDSPNAGCFFHRQTLCFRSPQGMTPPYPRTLPTIFAAVIKKQPALGNQRAGCFAIFCHYRFNANTSTPAATKPMPSHSWPLGFSPKNHTANSATSTKLNLSTAPLATPCPAATL